MWIALENHVGQYKPDFEGVDGFASAPAPAGAQGGIDGSIGPILTAMADQVADIIRGMAYLPPLVWASTKAFIW